MSVQLFFSWRIKVLTGSVWGALFVGFFGVVQFCASSACSFLIFVVEADLIV